MLPQQDAHESTRVRNWPVQAITYKYGSAVIRQLRSTEQARLSSTFDIRTVHDTILRNGALPTAVLPAMLARQAPPR